MKRSLLIGGGVLLIAVAGGIYVFVSSLDRIIKAAVEAYGSEATQTEVRLADVKLDLASGKGSLHGLTVGNPKGYRTPNVFDLGGISVALDTTTVTRNPVVIKEIVIDGPKVTFEIGPQGSNVTTIHSNIDAYGKRFAGNGREAKGKRVAEDEGTKLVIENLYVRRGHVNVSAAGLEAAGIQGRSMDAPLPDVHIKDIGKKSGGASPAEVAERVLASLTQASYETVQRLGLGGTLDSLKKDLEKSLGGAAKGAGQTIDGTKEGVGKSLKEGADEAGKAVKKLFGQ